MNLLITVQSFLALHIRSFCQLRSSIIGAGRAVLRIAQSVVVLQTVRLAEGRLLVGLVAIEAVLWFYFQVVQSCFLVDRSDGVLDQLIFFRVHFLSRHADFIVG